MRESDRLYSMLTKDLGFLRVKALGVRKEGSKLRGFLEPLAFSTVSLVKGREYWMVTSAFLHMKITSTPEILRPLNLLEKMMGREGSHPELFNDIEEHINNYLNKKVQINNENFESMLVAKMLYHLGYLDKNDLNLTKKDLIKAINNGLAESQLI